ncbi:ArsR/SmtB family transcription factor [Embleya sp. NPDC020630]|uniref:ArsR/SmtB family transcription factor n=1 Tax=unclassified Embleya TaxID=2699296 RepID=UPI003788535B
MTEREPFHPSIEQLRLGDVLGALADPVRLRLVELYADDVEHSCAEWPEELRGLHKSTVSHHQKTLREMGVVRVRIAGRNRYLTLRRDELDARFPGLLDAILANTGA